MGDIFIPQSTDSWISEEFERLAQVVQDYDHNLELRWIPHDRRTRDDKYPYVIVDKHTNTTVLHASELDTPVDILERLFTGDNAKGNVLEQMDRRNAAIQALRKREQLDELEELHDKAGFLLRSPLHTVRMDGKKFDHQRRVIE
jgi:hypothetical protein